MMSWSFLLVEETRPYWVRALLTEHLNRAKVVVMAAILVHHVETMVVEMDLASVTGQQ